MLTHVFLFELKYWLRKPSTYIYMLVFGGLLFFVMLGSAGFFDPQTAIDNDQVPRWLNSPYEVNYLLGYFNKFFLFLLPAIIGATIYRDYQNGASRLMYSFPINKSKYILAKFFSSFSIVIGITLFGIICLVFSDLLLGSENVNIGPFNGMGYIRSYVLITSLNIFIYGALVFMVVALFRNIYAGFMLVLVLFLLQIIIENIFASNPFFIALLDPFGQYSVMNETADWTQKEKNTLQLPLMGMVLYNRLFWLGIALFSGLYFFKKFTFSQNATFTDFFIFKESKQKEKLTSKIHNTNFNTEVEFDFSVKRQLSTLFSLAKFDLSYIVKNWIFLVFITFGLFAIIFAVGKVTNFNDLAFLPLTRLMLSVPLFFFSTIITIITIVFSGMIVHRNRSVGINELEDSSPTNSLVFLGSKFLALTYIQVLLLGLMVICGIAIQVYNGYFHFEIGLYLKYILAISLPPLIIWTCLSLLVHTLLKNVYLSIFLLILVWMGKDQLSMIGLDTHLIAFNNTKLVNYNDMNGFGHGLSAFTLITSYWMSWSIIFVIISALLWNREKYFSLKERYSIAKSRLNKYHFIMGIVASAAIVLFGFQLFKEERNVNKNKESGTEMKQFKAEFKVFKNTPQPSITNIELNLDLYPEDQNFKATGHYNIVNKHPFSLDTILLKTGYDENTEISLNRKYQIIRENINLKYSALLLEQPLSSGDSLILNFSISNNQNTILERNSGVLQNGTFLMQDILPRLGYFFNNETAQPSDPKVRSNNFYAPDADFVKLTSVMSTSSNQTAIAPGNLVQSWKEGERKYFKYQTEENIKLSFAFMSGKYTVIDTMEAGKIFKIYYHDSHSYNTHNILDGMQKSIQYNESNFSPYQQEDVNIIEFPLSEGTMSTAMGNIMPMSEQRFILNPAAGTDKIDLGFYVPAHELTHHWWGNQIIPADALGARLLTESITEYVTLQIYKDRFGPKKALQFLEVQHNRYLKGRTRERKKENPLVLVESGQDYIAYGKGAIAFNALSHYIGEVKFNVILKLFLEKYHSKKGIYPTSYDMINHLKNTIPEEYKYLIDDYFLSVLIFENSLINIEREKIGDLYQVTVDFEIKKKSIDKSEERPLNDWIEIGFKDERGEIFKVAKILVTEVENNLHITFTKKPASIVLDPNLLMIDRNRSKYQLTF